MSLREDFAELVNDPFTYAKQKGKQCFVCGADKDLTREHIFPRWLLRHFQLYDESLPGFAGDLRQFNKLQVKMCKTCNNLHFGRIESMMSSAVIEGGYERVKNLDKSTIFIWLAKIFLGLRFRELISGPKIANLDLEANTIKIETRPMLNPSQLGFARWVSILLHAARDRLVIMDNPAPFSVLIVDLVPFRTEKPEFQYWDQDAGRVISMRLGDLGIIAAFGEIGHNEQHYGDYLERRSEGKLDEWQFHELTVRVAYNTSLFPNIDPIFGSYQEAPDILVADVAYSSVNRAHWDENQFMKLLKDHFALQSVPQEIKDLLRPHNTFLFEGTHMKLRGPTDEVILVPPPKRGKIAAYLLPQPEPRVERALELAKELQEKLDSSS